MRRSIMLTAMGGLVVASASASAADFSTLDDPVARAAYCERVADAVDDEDAAADWYLALEMRIEEAGSNEGRAAGRAEPLSFDSNVLAAEHVACSGELAGLQDAIEAYFVRAYGDAYVPDAIGEAPSDHLEGEFDGFAPDDFSPDDFSADDLQPEGVDDEDIGAGAWDAGDPDRLDRESPA